MLNPALDTTTLDDVWKSTQARYFTINFILTTLWTASVRPINQAYDSWFHSRARCCDLLMKQLQMPNWEPIDPRIEEGLARLSALSNGKFEELDRSNLANEIDTLSHHYFRAFDKSWSDLMPVEGLTLNDWPSPKTIFFAFGPHIGIGDEMIMFLAVDALSKRYPEAKIEIWSYSKSLWDWNLQVDAHYIGQDSLAPFKRAQTLMNEDPTSLIGFGDYAFLKAYRLLETIPGLRRFFYIDLGTRNMNLVDQDKKQIIEFEDTNKESTVYESLEKLLKHAGVEMNLESTPAHYEYDTNNGISPKVFLNPHSSKSMPAVSAEWWIEALSHLGSYQRIELTVLSGLSDINQQFALEIIDGLNTKNISAKLLPPATLDAVLQEALENDLVISLDTFSAHINTLQNIRCVTLFFGSSGLSWHVPENIVLSAQIYDSPIHVADLASRLLFLPSDKLVNETLCALADINHNLRKSIKTKAAVSVLQEQVLKCRQSIAQLFTIDPSLTILFNDFPISDFDSLNGVLGSNHSLKPISVKQAKVMTTALKKWNNSNLPRYANYVSQQVKNRPTPTLIKDNGLNGDKTFIPTQNGQKHHLMKKNDTPYLLPLFDICGWEALQWSEGMADGIPSKEMKNLASLFDGKRTIGELQQLGHQPKIISDLVRKGFATVVPHRKQIRKTSHWLVLSPHSDDAVLSVGGTLTGLPDSTQISILTMIGPSRCAGTCPELYGDVKRVTQIRKAEDDLYGSFIGASVYCADLEDIEMYVDEEDHCWSDRIMNKPDSKRQESFTSALSNHLLNSTPDVILAPLAIGAHCDHTATHVALRSLLPELVQTNPSVRIVFYEDLPYCQIEEDELIKRLKEEKDIEPVEVKIDPRQKVNGVEIYRSQYQPEYISSVLFEYAQRRSSGNNGRYVERLWELNKKNIL